MTKHHERFQTVGEYPCPPAEMRPNRGYAKGTGPGGWIPPGSDVSALAMRLRLGLTATPRLVGKQVSPRTQRMIAVYQAPEGCVVVREDRDGYLVWMPLGRTAEWFCQFNNIPMMEK